MSSEQLTAALTVALHRIEVLPVSQYQQAQVQEAQEKQQLRDAVASVEAASA